ncbi:MAG: PaaI family thioesterase [Kouleothrix sp.]|nr:PaaI family thioesterase [Kouleothrix sp.]
MELSLEIAQAALSSQPFSMLLNANITSFGPGTVELRVPITRQLKQQHGFVHGGVVSYAADNALTFAGGAALGPAVVTSEFKINYLRPAKGEELVARASVIHAGKSQAVCQCQVFAVADGEEYLCAVAQGTIAALSQPT